MLASLHSAAVALLPLWCCFCGPAALPARSIVLCTATSSPYEANSLPENRLHPEGRKGISETTSRPQSGAAYRIAPLNPLILYHLSRRASPHAEPAKQVLWRRPGRQLLAFTDYHTGTDRVTKHAVDRVIKQLREKVCSSKKSARPRWRRFVQLVHDSRSSGSRESREEAPGRSERLPRAAEGAHPGREQPSP